MRRILRTRSCQPRFPVPFSLVLLTEIALLSILPPVAIPLINSSNPFDQRPIIRERAPDGSSLGCRGMTCPTSMKEYCQIASVPTSPFPGKAEKKGLKFLLNNYAIPAISIGFAVRRIVSRQVAKFAKKGFCSSTLNTKYYLSFASFAALLEKGLLL